MSESKQSWFEPLIEQKFQRLEKKDQVIILKHYELVGAIRRVIAIREFLIDFMHDKKFITKKTTHSRRSKPNSCPFKIQKLTKKFYTHYLFLKNPRNGVNVWGDWSHDYFPIEMRSDLDRCLLKELSDMNQVYAIFDHTDIHGRDWTKNFLTTEKRQELSQIDEKQWTMSTLEDMLPSDVKIMNAYRDELLAIFEQVAKMTDKDSLIHKELTRIKNIFRSFV